ncbi:MAG: hypothetical protein RLZZ371_1031 [Pseudomonadota bacterium]
MLQAAGQRGGAAPVSVVVPRPIALVTSVNEAGVVNAAPFSFFNLMGDDPPILILSIERKPGGAAKDTAHNIALQREFVVNLVPLLGFEPRYRLLLRETARPIRVQGSNRTD